MRYTVNSDFDIAIMEDRDVRFWIDTTGDHTHDDCSFEICEKCNMELCDLEIDTYHTKLFCIRKRD